VTPIMGFAARSVRGPTLIAQSLFRHLAANRSASRMAPVLARSEQRFTSSVRPCSAPAASVSRALTDEGLMSQEYCKEAEAGASLIAVLAPEPRLVSEARQILASHGARHMRFYGDTTITDL